MTTFRLAPAPTGRTTLSNGPESANMRLPSIFGYGSTSRFTESSRLAGSERLPVLPAVLDCSDAVLVRGSGRNAAVLHQSLDTAESIEGTIAAERRLLADVRSIADVIIDTTDLRPMDLRQRLLDIYEGKPLHKSVTVDVFSFGYKFGAPIDADMVFDVRFIPNPYYVDKLRPLTGADQGVYDYVMQFPITEVFLSRVSDLIVNLIPGYAREGKARLTVGIGCTGGQHRSVAVAIALHRRLQDLDVAASLRHRERSTAPTL